MARLVGPGETDVMAAVLADAFDQDPVFTFLFPPGSSRRHQRMTRMFRIDAVRSQRLGGAWTSDDGAAAAVWYPPGHWQPSNWENLRQTPQWIAVFGRRLPLSVRVLNTLQEHHRRLDPHWYLYYIGTRAERRDSGLGSALLQAVLERSDSEHMPAYLEATSERNQALYERHGFETRGEIALPGGGPPMFPMWRSPR
jgi:GNAT superfamily N-acetyltransferase